MPFAVLNAVALRPFAVLKSPVAVALPPLAVPPAPVAAALPPLAVLKSPVAVALVPFAVLALPVAVAWLPVALLAWPVAVALAPLAVLNSPVAVAPMPFAVLDAPITVASMPFAVLKAPVTVALAPFAVLWGADRGRRIAGGICIRSALAVSVVAGLVTQTVRATACRGAKLIPSATDKPVRTASRRDPLLSALPARRPAFRHCCVDPISARNGPDCAGDRLNHFYPPIARAIAIADGPLY